MKLTLLENFPGADVQPGMIAFPCYGGDTDMTPLLIVRKPIAGEMCMSRDGKYEPILMVRPTFFWAVPLYSPSSPMMLVCMDLIITSGRVKLYKVEP